MRTRTSSPRPPDCDRHREVEHDVVVVAGIDRDPVLRFRLHDAAHHVEGAIPVKRRRLDGDGVVDFGEAAPERSGKGTAADRRLEIEADQRNLIGDPSAMRGQRVLGIVLQRTEAQQPRVVAKPDRGFRFPDRLLRAPGEPGDHGDRAVGPLVGRLRPQSQHGLVESGLADGELCRVNAHREPARPGIEIVAGERALAPCIESAVPVEGQRMRRNDRAAPDKGPHFRRNVVSGQPHDGRSSRRGGEGSSGPSVMLGLCRPWR